MLSSFHFLHARNLGSVILGMVPPITRPDLEIPGSMLASPGTTELALAPRVVRAGLENSMDG